MSFANPVAGGDGGTLVRQTFQSQGFVTGSAGWQLTRVGHFEANDAVIRGSITVANGTVFVNNGGIAVKDSTHDYEINITAGFLARKIPDDGTWYQMANNGFFFNAQNPTPAGSTIAGRGLLFAGTVGSGASEQLISELTSPNYTAQSAATFVLYSETADGTTAGTNAILTAGSMNMNAATGGTVSHGDAEFINIPHRMVSQDVSGMDFAASQILTVSVTATGVSNVTVTNNWPVAFPSGHGVFGIAQQINNAAGANVWIARYTPAGTPTTQYSVVLFTTTGASGNFTATINVFGFCVPQ